MVGGSQVRWIMVFAVLLFACLVAPVLADPSLEASDGAPVEAPVEPQADETLFELGEVQPPDAEQVAAGIAGIEREEAARERELREPAAVRERQESRDAFTDLTGEQIRELLPQRLRRSAAEAGRRPSVLPQRRQSCRYRRRIGGDREQ